MFGRCQFTAGTDDMSAAIVDMLNQRHPGEHKTGEIFPGDTAPAVVSDRGRIMAVPAIFGFPGYQDSKLLINARSETAPASEKSRKNTAAKQLRGCVLRFPLSEIRKATIRDIPLKTDAQRQVGLKK